MESYSYLLKPDVYDVNQIEPLLKEQNIDYERDDRGIFFPTRVYTTVMEIAKPFEKGTSAYYRRIQGAEDESN